MPLPLPTADAAPVALACCLCGESLAGKPAHKAKYQFGAHCTACQKRIDREIADYRATADARRARAARIGTSPAEIAANERHRKYMDAKK